MSLEKIIKEMNLDQYNPNDYVFGHGLITCGRKLRRLANISDAHREATVVLKLRSDIIFYGWKHTGCVELYNKVKSIADELRTGTGSGASGSTDQAYRLELAAHDYLVKNIAYNESSETDDGAYGALTSGQAVCNGYAESFMLLCNFLGIENTAISGYAGGEPHIWNEVKLGNDWYQVDVTWDDPVRSNFKSTDHTYFNISSADMDLDHSFETTQAPYREATGSAYTYLNQTFVESIASNSALTARLRVLISSKASSFEFTTPAELDINSAANAVGMSYAFSYKMHTYTDSTYYQVNFTY
jgi:hypothetical protein